MTAAVVLSNLMYPLGAVVLAIVICALVMVRHHRPQSVESDISTFHRGLKALAPEDRPHANRVATLPSPGRPPARPGRGVPPGRPSGVAAQPATGLEAEPAPADQPPVEHREAETG